MPYRMIDEFYYTELKVVHGRSLILMIYNNDKIVSFMFLCELDASESNLDAGCFKHYAKNEQPYKVQFNTKNVNALSVEQYTNKLLKFIGENIKNPWSLRVWPYYDTSNNQQGKDILIYDLSFSNKGEAVYTRLAVFN
jgi:hypothetical protein